MEKRPATLLVRQALSALGNSASVDEIHEYISRLPNTRAYAKGTVLKTLHDHSDSQSNRSWAEFRGEPIPRYFQIHRPLGKKARWSLLELPPDWLPPQDESEVEDEEGAEFDPADLADARQIIERAIIQRQGDLAFRQSLLHAYEGRCAITGCDVLEALEAAHIVPYRGEHTNAVDNGLLLRADIHTLFDRNLIGIDPTGQGTVVLSPRLRGTAYRNLAGKKLNPRRKGAQPTSNKALTWRFSEFQAWTKVT